MDSSHCNPSVSRWLVGSSSRRKPGRPARARARAARVFWPPKSESRPPVQHFPGDPAPGQQFCWYGCDLVLQGMVGIQWSFLTQVCPGNPRRPN